MATPVSLRGSVVHRPRPLLRRDRSRHHELGGGGVRWRGGQRGAQRAGRDRHAVGRADRQAGPRHGRHARAPLHRIRSGEHRRGVQAADGHRKRDRLSEGTLCGRKIWADGREKTARRLECRRCHQPRRTGQRCARVYIRDDVVSRLWASRRRGRPRSRSSAKVGRVNFFGGCFERIDGAVRHGARSLFPASAPSRAFIHTRRTIRRALEFIETGVIRAADFVDGECSLEELPALFRQMAARQSRRSKPDYAIVSQRVLILSLQA